MAETREFNIQVNVAGLGPVDVMMEDPSPGPHMMEILDVKMVTGEKEGDKNTLRFSVMDAEEGSITRGISTMVVMGLDWQKEFNVRHIVNLLMGMGVKQDKLKGVIALSPANFIGKKVPVYVKAAPDELDELGRKRFANKNFITLDMYAAAKRSAAALGARIPAANQPRVSQAANQVMSPVAPTVTTTTTIPATAANGPAMMPAANSAPVVELGDLFG